MIAVSYNHMGIKMWSKNLLTCGLGVLHSFADLRCEALDKGIDLVTCGNRILNDLH